MISITITKSPCSCYEDSNGDIICSEECIAAASINDSLIETEEVATSRATQFIRGNYSDRVMISGVQPLSGYIKPGTMVMYTDMEKGDFPSLITASEIVIKKSDATYTADLNVQLEREA